jgi:hypothetical protein
MECYICLEFCESPDMEKLSCEHVYHQKCLCLEFMQQLRYQRDQLDCPYCRKILESSYTHEFISMLQIKNIEMSTEIIVKTPAVEYEAGMCCVLRGEDVKQCKKRVSDKDSRAVSDMYLAATDYSQPPSKKKKSERGDGPSKIFQSLDSTFYLNNYDFFKHYMCFYHQKNLAKVKYMIHPVHSFIYKLTKVKVP